MAETKYEQVSEEEARALFNSGKWITLIPSSYNTPNDWCWTNDRITLYSDFKNKSAFDIAVDDFKKHWCLPISKNEGVKYFLTTKQ